MSETTKYMVFQEEDDSLDRSFYVSQDGRWIGGLMWNSDALGVARELNTLAAEIAVYRKALAEIEVCSTRADASYIAAQVFKEHPLPHPDTYLNNK